MAASPNLNHPPALQQLPKHGVLVLHGFGIKVRLDNSHFFAEWGVGLNRYQVRLSRVDGHRLRRVILLSSDGYISLEALRFITDVGASLSLIDKRGQALMVCSPVAPSDSKLRRAQSLTITNGTALRLSKEIISQKLEGQAALVRDMLHNDAAADAIERIRIDELPTAQSLERVRYMEAVAGKIYWTAWSDVPVMWVKKDSKRIPERFKHFNQRVSELSHSPRLSTNPPNSLLNMLYGLGENSSRIVLASMGLDADIGLLHVDVPNRSSLALDLLEFIRPRIDSFVLNWLQAEPFRKSDWFEARDGSCRMVTSLAVKLCETSETWTRLLSPHAEWLALKLYESTVPARRHFSRSVVRLATRLTQRHRKSSKGSEVPTVPIPKPEHVCSGCGKKLPSGKIRCLKCSVPVTRQNFRTGRKIAQTPDSIARRSDTMRAHKRAIANWNPADLPSWLARDAYKERVLPALASVTPTQICRALNVSWPYAKAIQNGHIPNTRHWEKLARLVGIVPST